MEAEDSLQKDKEGRGFGWGDSVGGEGGREGKEVFETTRNSF